MWPFSRWPSFFEQGIFNSNKYAHGIHKPTRFGIAGIHAISVALHDSMRNEGLDFFQELPFPPAPYLIDVIFLLKNMSLDIEVK